MRTRTVQLGGVCEFVYGQALKEENRRNGKFPVYGSNGVVGRHDQAITRGATIVIGRKGSIGEVNWSNGPCFPIDTTYYVDRTKRPCDLRWLYYALLKLDLTRLNKSAAVPGLNRDDAYEQRIRFPDVPEQERTAALLDRANGLLRTRRYAREIADSFLHAAFLERFGEQSRDVREWRVEPLGEHLEAIEGGVNFNPVGENDLASDWRVLKVSAVSWSDFLPEESKPISPTESFGEKLIVRCGDLIMSRANTVELVGAVARVRTPPPKVLLPDKLWRLKFRAGSQLLPDYLLYALRSGEVRREIEIRASGTSGSMKNISKDDVRELRLTLPPPKLQEKFAALVERVERLRAVEAEAFRQAEHLFASLLHRAFSV